MPAFPLHPLFTILFPDYFDIYNQLKYLSHLFLFWNLSFFCFKSSCLLVLLIWMSFVFLSSCSNIFIGLKNPFPSSHAFPHGRKVILAVDRRMMLLLREWVLQHWGSGAQGFRGKLWRSGSLECCSCDGWAVKRPIVQITQQAPCHHPGLIYGAVRSSAHIALRRV